MSARIWFRPIVGMEQQPDGSWRMTFDWESSCDGEDVNDDGREVWTDKAQEACDVLDAYCKSAGLNDRGIAIIQEEPDPLEGMRW